MATKKIVMAKPEFVKEHKHLVKVLQDGKQARQKEARKQQRELTDEVKEGR